MILNTRLSLAAALTAGLALSALSACALADGMPPTRTTAKLSPAGLKGSATPWVTASRKPNDSGVKLQYRLGGAPQAGKPTVVVLQFDGVSDPAGASVALTVDAGLTLSGSASLSLPPGQRSDASVTVVSQGEGLAYLNVFITQGGRTSAISIPIQTGAAAPAMKAGGEIKSLPGGDNIISLPAK
ncbi:hypothetical protein FFI97_023745 [Variovorax sp. KBS0712]|uniref:hypothetical protein n=1 Tax=Variovorax sp. KBS0712 TaxID=2578111 RepID=UPI001119D7E3|nr:hypothetical protein [Variovorax sp. KBS0712]TSD57156.1 hypothetical protein FFI97_023745 [Variovorax sp. KBS0712]